LPAFVALPDGLGRGDPLAIFAVAMHRRIGQLVLSRIVCKWMNRLKSESGLQNEWQAG
jgi:hypothetical protein